MEFKGTKGWKLLKDSVIYDEQCSVVADCLVLCEEDLANALLISKAPEMLEMLIYIYKEYKDEDFFSSVDSKLIKQLIKQATEL